VTTKSRDAPPVEIRYASDADSEQLLKLLDTCFPAEKWTEADITAFYYCNSHKNIIKVIADLNINEIYGFFMYTLTADTCRLRRLGVHPEVRRLGLAEMLLRSVISFRGIRSRRFFARIREHYFEAQCLLHKLHFTFNPGEPRSLYSDTGEEGYVFTHPALQPVPERG
jgi:N-acetylglutamate synthase-like GNAT family acetyltransferase